MLINSGLVCTTLKPSIQETKLKHGKIMEKEKGLAKIKEHT